LEYTSCSTRRKEEQELGGGKEETALGKKKKKRGDSTRQKKKKRQHLNSDFEIVRNVGGGFWNLSKFIVVRKIVHTVLPNSLPSTVTAFRSGTTTSR
jgi:hypothetical protein